MITRTLLFTPGKMKPEERMLDIGDGGHAALRAAVEPLICRPKVWWDHVSVLYEGQRRDMFVDEFSALTHPETKQGPLSINDAATKIYWSASIARGEKPHPSWACVHGPALLFADLIVWR